MIGDDLPTWARRLFYVAIVAWGIVSGILAVLWLDLIFQAVQR